MKLSPYRFISSFAPTHGPTHKTDPLPQGGALSNDNNSSSSCSTNISTACCALR